MSSGNAEPYARQKIKALTGGEQGRHLSPRLVGLSRSAEGKTSYDIGWKVKMMTKKNKK